MENLSVALKHVSQAVDLDSNGFQQAAFSKYIQSLQVLIFYLNSLFTSSGFKKMLERKKEVVQVLSMIHECSDRIAVILDDCGKPITNPLPQYQKHHNTYSTSQFSASTIPAFEKLHHENMKLFKNYKMRLEKTTDKTLKTNLTLEFQRRLTENSVLAKNKYDLAVKKLQKERVQLMENAIRKLFENSEQLTEKEKEKRQLYDRVLQYVKTEVWPSSWKVNPYDMTTFEITEKLFYRILRCCEHPLSQWLLLIQTNIKRKIDILLKEYHDYTIFTPDLNSGTELSYSVEENAENIVIKHLQSVISISSTKIISLEDSLETVTSEIRNTIENIVEIFYLVYKSLLPEESEDACYHVIQKYFLKPLWPNLLTLFRILNLLSEFKVFENMYFYKTCSPTDFGNISLCNFDACKDSVALLKSIQQDTSVMYKLKVLVQVSQKICECDIVKNGCQRKLGMDDLLPLLCYIIVQSKLPELVSECDMLAHLFDMRYMLGEEGFALSSFQTALKCIEIKKLTECNDIQNTEEKT